MQEIEFWFEKLVILLFDTLKQIGNLLFRMISNTGGLGSAMKELVNILCWFVSVVLDIWNVTLCVLMRDVVAPILQILLDILQAVIGVLGGDPHILDLLHDVLDVMRNLECNTTLTCSNLGVELPSQAVGALPVTSRCWADYTPGVDDTSSYACSRSDTCSNADLSYGVTVKVSRAVGSTILFFHPALIYPLILRPTAASAILLGRTSVTRAHCRAIR